MQWSVKMDSRGGEEYIAVDEKGPAVLLNPFTNKGVAFTAAERDALDLHGILPPAYCPIEQQLERTYQSFRAKSNDLEKFIYLAALQDRNETLYFRLIHTHIEEMMPIVYTPVVGEACQKFSQIYRRPRGLYVSFDQRNNIEKVLRSHPRQPAVIVVTDGERILGLGDQGLGGMGIPIGKLSLYTVCAGVPPHCTLPITLDVGTDNEDLLNDPLYLGLRHKRVRDAEYQSFVDAFVGAIKKVFPKALLQWEDFLKANAMKQLGRFRDDICSFNDDIQGTAAVTLAGIHNGLKITGQSIREQRILIAGAGAAAQGIADLLVSAMREDGLSLGEATKRIWTVDSRGLVTKSRSGLQKFKARYARDVEELEGYRCNDRDRITLEETVLNARPTILLGTTGRPGLFSEEVVRASTGVDVRPMIFPLSNPTSRSECTAEEAIVWSGGSAIVATGSPFSPVEHNGRRYRIGQCNNAYVFPGVGLGIWASKARRVTDGMFLDAARALADMVTDKDLAESSVYPELTRIRECSHAVACAVIKRAVQEGLADEQVLEHLGENVANVMWFPEYRPTRYEATSAGTGAAVQ